MTSESVLSITPVRSVPWQTFDPFLFCVYHQDAYPSGNDRLGPAASLAGRNIGMDFEGKDGWRMYHGSVVPGFPQHPHRGFETVTIMRKGYIDHSDSLGATARFGRGDVQWLTAGKGIVHCEMFPLLNPSGPNPAELFQIWLNLPSSDKFVEPYFSMFWDQNIPRHTVLDAKGRSTEVVVVAGHIGSTSAPPPPPNSWAARASADVAIWTIRMAPEAEWTLPPASAGVNRTLYSFQGKTVDLGGTPMPLNSMARLRSDSSVTIRNSSSEAEFLLLQGKPIGEPVVQYGPFVMNSRTEIQQAFEDYQRTGFGGWPWPADDPVFPRTQGRYARHADGRVEQVE
ncbi:MAG TPA: pirin-like C-terminal cupin domain-containing protein [Terriglobia bacterium]|nr:pirin-like C-terminal cupin domain-containing protein [Terriglobia bacterium]